MTYSFIIPTINQTELVNQCVSSLIKYHLNRNDYEIIVVDDGSDQKTKNYLSDIKDIDVLIFNQSNSGFSSTVNKGIEASKGDVIVLVNNDIIFTKNITNSISNALNKEKTIGIVGAKLIYPNGKLQHAGVVRTGVTTFGHIYKNLSPTITQVNEDRYYIAVTGALFAITRKCLTAVGKFNDEFFVACEDVEFCLRAWQSGFKVLYSHNVEAIHIEGFTRGNNDATKLIKGKEWMEKEKAGIKKFEKILKRFNLANIENDVSKANQLLSPKPVKKVEIGCGFNPQPGYIHLDIRKLPHVDIVCDFEKDKLPFRDSEVDEIINNHVIEHVSWRNLPFILGEWHRVLKPGGRVFLRTPDLEFIVKTYLAKKTTPEWPGDENYIKINLCDRITPAWWANIKLFAGQDYPSNFHKLCFDFEMLKELFTRFGFGNIMRLHITPIYSPGEIQMECFKL